jgi:Carboxypeptidase regulatory-like domain
MRAIATAIMVVLGLVILPAPSFGQALGTITGVVKDSSGAVLPGATVEASSPALIEKVRTVVTDGSGQYRIVSLPTGIYSVTVSLQGFSSFKRDGIEVTANFISSVNADLKVGTVAETLTVTAESPIVDVQSAAQTRALTAEAFKEMPTSGVWIQMAAMIPAVQTMTRDVGGSTGDTTGAQISTHGGLPGDGVSLLDGLRIGNMYISSNVSNMSLSPLLFDQVDISFSGQMGESGTNGVLANMLPKSGGNTFHGSFLANGSGPGLQGDNITQRLQDRGLTTASTTLKKLYDINGAIGGPIKRDKLWFYFTSRYLTNNNYIAGLFYPVDPSAVVRVENPDEKAYLGTWTRDNNLRLTWAASQRHKISAWYAYQRKQDPFWTINATLSPEAARVTEWYTQLGTLTWTYTATNRLLIEAGVSPGASPDTILAQSDRISGIPIVEQGLNPAIPTKPITYRNTTLADQNSDEVRQQSYKASASYVTGSHAVKVGMDLQRGYFGMNNFANPQNDVQYRTNGYVPNLVTIFAPLAGWKNRLNYNMGIYAQDRWTMNRLTLGGGIRFDLQNESADAFTANTTRWTPNRNTFYPEVKDVPNWRDINPRINASYDLFGNGKTAIKASASRAVEQDSVRYANGNNPGFTVQTTGLRGWNDLTFPVGDPRRANFVPDCDLLNPAVNGECAGTLSPNFGLAVPAQIYDRAIMEGWGVRPWNWEFSTGVQHEIMPRLSAGLTFFRRVQGNFFVTDNEALGPNDFIPFSVTLPTDPLLPNSGGTLSGLYDQKAVVVNKNVVKAADQFGNQYQHWNGFDLTVDSRPRSGLFLQGGVSSGVTTADNCEIVKQVPEALLPTLGLLNSQGISVFPLAAAAQTGVWIPDGYCHQDSGWVTTYKALGSYGLPWDVRVSGTFQSVQGPFVLANVLYNNADIAAGRVQGLGRPNFLNAGQTTIGVIDPGSQYGDRLNQVDFRVTKIFRMAKGSFFEASADVYNLFNSDAILTQQPAYGSAWRRPTAVIQPRFVKFTGRFDF